MRPSRRAGLPLAALTGAALAAALLLVAAPSLAQLPADAPDAPAVTEAPWTAWLATTLDDNDDPTPGPLDFLDSGSSFDPTDIEFTSKDQPVILYHARDPDGTHVPHLKERTPLGWTTDPLPSDIPAGDGSLALDDQDQPHVAFRRGSFTTDPDLMYAHRTASGAWDVTRIDNTKVRGIDIELNDTGHPRIIYQAGDSSPHFAYKTSSGWVTEQVDSEGGHNQDLALDSNGDPHIAYRIVGDIWYANKTDGSWVTELAKADCAVYVSLALDAQDRPHITCDPAEGLAYVWKDAAGWQHEIVDDGSGPPINRDPRNVGESSSLVLDETDTPHIGYRYIPNFGAPLLAPGQPHYATQVDGEWVVEVVDRDGQHSGAGMDLALDDEDRPHLTYVRDDRFEDGGGFPGSGALQSLLDLRYARPLAAETAGQAGR